VRELIRNNIFILALLSAEGSLTRTYKALSCCEGMVLGQAGAAILSRQFQRIVIYAFVVSTVFLMMINSSEKISWFIYIS
jgi:hypothetical protein